MKLCVLALDYDGTIAIDGVMDPGVREAIKEARNLGITCVLVTGRILGDLQRLVPDLDIFESVVAENGAVVAFPAKGYSATVGQPPPPSFFRELSLRGIPFTNGESVVETDAGLAWQVLTVIRDLELPLSLLFNRGRLMVLPQAVSKATGLRYAMRTLRLSEHNAIAIGDAENDHQLLRTCEIGVAVSWGSEALKDMADNVLQGQGPPAVADFIRKVSQKPRMSPRQARHRRLLLGTGENGQAVSLAIQGRNILINGDSQSGKSWVAGLLCEQLILHHYSMCIIDAEGDYASLAALPGVVVLGGDDPPPTARDIARTLRYADVSVVLDLSKLGLKEKYDYVRSVLPVLLNIRREMGIPHRILIDEAHYFLQAPDSAALLDRELGGYIMVSYQALLIDAGVLSMAEAVIVTRESSAEEIRVLRSLQPGHASEAEWQFVLGNLNMDEAALLPGVEEACDRLCKFKVTPRLTSHVRHRNKYIDMPLPEKLAFVFVSNGARVGKPAGTMKDFLATLSAVSGDVLAGHVRRNDFSRWIRDVFRDGSLADIVHGLETQYAAGAGEDISEFRQALISTIERRYRPGEPIRPTFSSPLAEGSV